MKTTVRTPGEAGITSTRDMLPSYRDKLNPYELKERANRLRNMLEECTLCPRECRSHRLDGRYGVCRTANEVMVASVGPHYGEEAPLVGRSGSGTIFFTSCNLKCLFCQNYDISDTRIGHKVSVEQLAGQMLSLQVLGCHNINLVTPTHVVPQIIESLCLAVEKGLSIPIVYNCGGYESVETLALLEDIVDIYMPDIKYSDNETAKTYSGATDYWDVVRPAVKEMHRQVGNLEVDRSGVARRGLLVRHLVLPNQLAGSTRVLDFIASDISDDCYVNIMDQYRPAFRAHTHREVDRKITDQEYTDVVAHARSIGLHRGFDGE